jgi:hypothetical protein
LNYKALMLRVLGTPRVGEHVRTTSVTEECTESFNYRQLNATFIKLAIHLGFIGFLAYWTFVLVGPFIPIIVWSVVLTFSIGWRPCSEAGAGLRRP